MNNQRIILGPYTHTPALSDVTGVPSTPLQPTVLQGFQRVRIKTLDSWFHSRWFLRPHRLARHDRAAILAAVHCE